jgi:polysaccharide biosynthesis protein PslH
MKILFVTASYPFPPKNGVELPIYNLINNYSKSHTVDLLVIGNNQDKSKGLEDKDKKINNIRNFYYIEANKKRSLISIFKEFFFIDAYFMNSFLLSADIDKLPNREKYDFIWVSPLSVLRSVYSLIEMKYILKSKIIVGHNDASYGLYLNGFRYLLKRTSLSNIKRVVNAFRVPWIFYYERKYLKKVDAIHVQTALEEKRVVRLFYGLKKSPKIITIQNGKSNIKTNSIVNESVRPGILFMTHLSGGRADESSWFIKKVWPLILYKYPNARLLLVGTPPKDLHKFRKKYNNIKHIEIFGYVDDLNDVFTQTSVAVVPTIHNSGWVNRISDYLQASLPIVACSEPIKTINGFLPGVHGEVADSPKEFADKVVNILSDKIFATKLSRSGNSLSDSFPSWSEQSSYILNKATNFVHDDNC